MIYNIHTYNRAFKGIPVSTYFKNLGLLHFKNLGLLQPVFKHPTLRMPEATVSMIDQAFDS